MAKVFNRAIRLAGESRKINSITVTVLDYDADGKVMRCSGTTVPTGAGYAKGAIFIKTDVASGSRAVYENVGTTTSASFQLIGGGVSYYIVAAGQHTTAGGDVNESATVSGALATDIAIASLEDDGTNNVTLLTAAAAAGQINFVLSADPGTDAVINYTVLRAVS